MEPETPFGQPSLPENTTATNVAAIPPSSEPEEVPYRGLRWAFIGPQGLRAGWSAVLFIFLSLLLVFPIGAAVRMLTGYGPHRSPSLSPLTLLMGEMISVLVILAAASIMALIENRRILDYNLRGSRRLPHFLSGLAVGFFALSALVGVMAASGHLHFGPVALSGTKIFGYGALWGLTFLGTGLFEEGSFRCYLQYTLTRGINFWWALGTVAVICLDLVLRAKGNGLWGVYGIALALLVPCLVLHLKRVAGASFWYAAWVTSTLFGFLHTGNNGENWIGIFSAAAIGFVFCVSVRLTGSAWWGIGCHAAWDWAETFFYGTADSGFTSRGHFLTTSPVGNVLWSGGTDGPEGSVLVLGAILLILAILILAYGRRKSTTAECAEAPLTAG